MTAPTKTRPADGTALIQIDPWLEPYAPQLRDRFSYYQSTLKSLESQGGLLGPISQGHHYFGLNRGELWGKKGVWYREWAPEALQLRLIGDFNGWDRFAHPMVRDQYGVWSLFLPDDQYAQKLVHQSKVKVHVINEKAAMDRIPAYIRRVIQEESTRGFVGEYWAPPQPYQFHQQNPGLPDRQGLRIYETHVGMAQEQEKVGTFKEFIANVLPRIPRLGYNAIQVMAIMEHPYYGSFGYHVSNFFAVSSRFGTPEELKELIDSAHGLGILVLLDIVHSHSVKNTHEGLAMFDGSEYQYFHAGGRGQHTAWDSLVFDYSKYEVRRFLLSNCRYWLEEYRFDGFRFDGVTSMMYLDHGLGKAFTSYNQYFDGNVDRDAILYLQLANTLIHQVNPEAISIAEDVSGMVGIARPPEEGGIGFDYRLSMGVPDYWIKILKEKKDEEWNLGEIYHMLLNRRPGEKHIGYVESHDQSLVGDKTIAFRLMDKEMYWHMTKQGQNLVIDRGIALHKLIRLFTFSLGGEGYLTFMGNEFGHPEWVDFPREGNGYSYKFARRQWSLVDRDDLRYADLNAFDAALMDLDKEFGVLVDPLIEQLLLHESDHVIAYRRGPLVFVLNFHPTQSYTDYRIPIPDPYDYKLILDTDAKRFSGFGRVAEDATYWKQATPMYGRQQSIQMYLPNRSGQVLLPNRP